MADGVRAADIAEASETAPLYQRVKAYVLSLAQGYDPTGAGPLRTARLAAAVAADCYRVGASGWPSNAEGEYTIRAEFVPMSTTAMVRSSEGCFAPMRYSVSDRARCRDGLARTSGHARVRISEEPRRRR